MKHSKEQIIEKAKIIMKDLKGKFYTDSCIDDAFFREKEQVHYGKHDGQVMSCWIISVKSLFDNLNFLTISDETGEPLYSLLWPDNTRENFL